MTDKMQDVVGYGIGVEKETCCVIDLPDSALSFAFCRVWAHTHTANRCLSISAFQLLPHQMPTQDDFQYAMETTRVLHEPDHRIQTFGETRFQFQLISEPMDQVGKVRIRKGDVEAMKPRILRPEPYREIELEGFDEDARARLDELVEKLKSQGRDLAFLQYDNFIGIPDST